MDEDEFLGKMKKKEMRAGKGKSTGFFSRVYEVVARIPRGKVATYGQVAALAGNPLAARQVGYAMSGAGEELGLPCHRVVNRKGELAPDGVFVERSIQRGMLLREGVTFLANGCIDLERHRWGVEE